MSQIVCFGEILWDKLPTGKKPGGAPMNVAIHLKKHGAATQLISSVGDDEDGGDLRTFLAASHLSGEYVQTHKTLATGVVDVSLDEHQQASYIIKKPVAWDEIFWNDGIAGLTDEAEALVFGSLACRSEISRQTLMKLLDTSKCSIFDMNLRPPHFEKHTLDVLMRKCDVLKINEHELDYLKNFYGLKGTSGNQLIHLGDLTATNTICLTLGENGAMILHKGKIFTHPGFEVQVLDTVGAGDAFLASFIYGYLEQNPMDEILTRACATGALVASRRGANPEYKLSDVDQIYKF